MTTLTSVGRVFDYGSDNLGRANEQDGFIIGRETDEM
jgi:hypothetical protein